MANLGWKLVIVLKDGFKEAYKWFIVNTKVVRGSIK
jgi:hypothetical protein